MYKDTQRLNWILAWIRSLDVVHEDNLTRQAIDKGIKQDRRYDENG